ncbi:Serine/Threonine kinase domain protein (macronuclear) [Tetrahymena thermophila SB210]|uniref:non-specific serine/threonine protein kinase n=1 Tax=Tetrahymena thermophila (strain SB210) TaxID=312017 RepID=I7M6X3_TETTS|nr:Serine/Threonine kinase domain protein [Tetrahymena thermophila SB210]EAR87428.2 Serine/Threonine kinase domain protein [Tetrahymena thermophila SB210]|eukprot:XP_001007673.2 Serine/Threonine kinase domain protein [Tetrahymena thermophila SB210]
MNQDEISSIVDEDEQNQLKEEYSIELIEKIDEGSFGVVFKGRDIQDGSLCAVKVTQNNKEKYTSIETSILRGLDHPNIVKFKKFIELDSNKYIVMEYIGCGTLQQLIEERKAKNNPFNQQEISVIMSHLMSALKCMHENNVLHRDIKPENILLGSKEDLSKLKLSDFGLSVKYQDGVPFKSYSQKCGTVIFMAPEILAEKQYSKPIDIWSCGIILYMLYTMGKHPFKSSSISREEYIKKIINLDVSKEVLDEDDFPSDLAKDLLLRMLNKEPSNRYTASQVLKHPFITRKLNSSIPLSFQESARVFQNERKLSQAIKAILVLKYIQQKSTKQTENSIKIQPLKIKMSPQKYKTFDEKDSPATERQATRKTFTNEQDLYMDNMNKNYLQMDSSPNFDLKRAEDSPARNIRLNVAKINEKSNAAEKLTNNQSFKFKLQIPLDHKVNNKFQIGQAKSQTNSPNQPNSSQSKDNSPQLINSKQIQLGNQQNLQISNSYSKFYAESPNSVNQKNIQLPQINKGQNSLQSTPIFFGKKDNQNLFNFGNQQNQPNQAKMQQNQQKLSAHAQRAQRPQQNGGVQLISHIKTNSLQRPIQTPINTQSNQPSYTNLSSTSKQVRKSSQNFQIKLVTNPHNQSTNSVNISACSSGSPCLNTSSAGVNENNNNNKQKQEKQLSFHKQSLQLQQQQSRESVKTPNSTCSNNSNNNSSTTAKSNSRSIPKNNSQPTLQILDSRPNTRQKEGYKPSQFSSQAGIKDSDLNSPQKSIQQIANSIQSFPHSQRVLTESRKVIYKDSFDFLECEEDI